MEMSRLTRDGTAETSCETKYSGANGNREICIFLVQLTTSRMDNLTRLVLVLHVCVCVCMCFVIPLILNVRLMDVPAGVTQEERRTGFLRLPSAVPALFFLARRIQPFLSLVDREVEFCVLTNYSLCTLTCWAFFILFYFL